MDCLPKPQLLRLPCSAPAAEAPFHAGTAISVWQNSGAVWQSLGGGPSNWDTWVHKKTLFGGSPIMGGHKVGAAVAATLGILAHSHIRLPCTPISDEGSRLQQLGSHSMLGWTSQECKVIS
jgi:hypothetical protein